jgi:hypothetical protein
LVTHTSQSDQRYQKSIAVKNAGKRKNPPRQGKGSQTSTQQKKNYAIPVHLTQELKKNLGWRQRNTLDKSQQK